MGELIILARSFFRIELSSAGLVAREVALAMKSKESVAIHSDSPSDDNTADAKRDEGVLPGMVSTGIPIYKASSVVIPPL